MKTQSNLFKNTLQLESDIENFLEKRIKQEAPNVSVEYKINIADFKNKYVLENKPVILKGMIEEWPAIKNWELDYFAQKCGDAEVNVNLYDAKNIKKSTIKNLISEIKKTNPQNPVYLQEWWFHGDCPELFDDVKVPQLFADDQNLKLLGFYNSTLWIGSKGAKTRVHQDTVYSNIWTSQIRGKKEWILFDKNAVLNATKDGKADYEEFLSNKNNHIMHCTLEKGDVLYVPYKWWHRAKTIEDAVSMNTFYITDEIVQKYIRDVMSIPMAISLNHDLLKEHDPMRYNICMSRINILSDLLGYNKENVLGIKINN